MDKKNTQVIVIVVIVIIALIVLILVKNPNKEEKVLTPDQIELNEAVNNDTTTEIKTNLDSIDVTDNSDEDLKAIDEELNNL